MTPQPQHCEHECVCGFHTNYGLHSEPCTRNSNGEEGQFNHKCEHDTRPHTSSTETQKVDCKKYWSYRADSGNLYHLIYDLTGTMPTEETLPDLMIKVLEMWEVRSNADTAIRNETLDSFIDNIEDKLPRYPSDLGDMYLLSDIQSLRSTKETSP